MLPRLCVTLALATLAASGLPSVGFAASDMPSRTPLEGCAWERISDAGTGLTAWVQSCDFGEGRTLGYVFDGSRLAQTSTDFEGLSPVAEVFDIQPGEQAADAVKRIYAAKTDKAVAEACILQAETEMDLPDGIARYSFVPGPALQETVDAETVTGEIPDSRCGPYGMVYDSQQYFQTIAGAEKIVFLWLGQDEPLFDDVGLSFE